MKTVGIIGGIGPESTVEYYEMILAGCREQRPEDDPRSILINSVNLKRLIRLFEAGEYAAVAEYLGGEVQRIAKAGADFGLLSANTPHVVFDEIQRQSPIPLVSIVQATCDEAKAQGLKKVGLFGTRFTMQGRFYPDVFSRAGIIIVVPNESEQAYIHDKYLNELLKSKFLPETRAQLLAIAKRMTQQDAIEALILGGTELPLILRDSEEEHVPFLDTTQIHVKSIVAGLLA